MARTVLVISDTHGLHENLRKVLAIEAGKYDAVFHLGDVEGGEITPIHKPRGDKKATEILVQMMKERGFFDGGILRIAHCFGEVHAQALADAVVAEYPNAKITIEPTTALCSFYAEAGGLIIGFQGDFNAANDNTKF